MVDNYRHKGLRKGLINELKSKGIKDERILLAFMDIPRHFFIDQAFADWAYKDVPFKIGADQTISQPYTVAFMTELLEIKSGDKVLEIGTGSGYQACVLNYIGAKVYTIERQETLYHTTKKFLTELGYQDVRCILGDGYAGLPRFAPFDKIIVTAGAVALPEDLIDQLKPGGLMVVPIGDEDTQVMNKVIKKQDGNVHIEEHGTFKFVPFLPGINSVNL